MVGVAFAVDGQYITFGTAPALAADADRQIRAVSAWRAVAGHHRLTAVVDDVNRYPEMSEDNNRLEMPFHILPRTETPLPDSIVNQIRYEVNQAGQIVLLAEVANIGNAATSDVVGVAFFVDDIYKTFGTTPRWQSERPPRFVPFNPLP